MFWLSWTSAAANLSAMLFWRCFCASWLRICTLSGTSSGRVLALMTGPSASIRCQPNCVLTGFETTPWGRLKATSAKGLTRLARFETPSSPPTDLLLSIEYFLASSAKLASDDCSWAYSWSASALSLTRMWRSLRRSGSA